MFYNDENYVKEVTGAAACQGCGKLIQYQIELQPDESRILMCDSCSNKVKESVSVLRKAKRYGSDHK